MRKIVSRTLKELLSKKKVKAFLMEFYREGLLTYFKERAIEVLRDGVFTLILIAIKNQMVALCRSIINMAKVDDIEPEFTWKKPGDEYPICD